MAVGLLKRSLNEKNSYLRQLQDFMTYGVGRLSPRFLVLLQIDQQDKMIKKGDVVVIDEFDILFDQLEILVDE